MSFKMVAGRNRSGISLLEILISVLIIAIGLLGILSLVVLGHHETQRGLLAERGALIADYGYHDFRVRGMGPAEAIGDLYGYPDDLRFSWRPTILDSNGFVVGPDQFQDHKKYTLRIEVFFDFIEDAPYDDPRNFPIFILDRTYWHDDAVLWKS
jgi:hypothetical protein